MPPRLPESPVPKASYILMTRDTAQGVVEACRAKRVAALLRDDADCTAAGNDFLWWRRARRSHTLPPHTSRALNYLGPNAMPRRILQMGGHFRPGKLRIPAL